MTTPRWAASILFFQFLTTVISPATCAGDTNTEWKKDKIPPLTFQIKLETPLVHDDRKSLWYHPRVAAIPGAGKGKAPAVVMTLQKHLAVSDHYSGLSVMHLTDLAGSWTKPDARPELDWRKESDQVTIGVCDVTPGWHAKTGKLLAIGVKVRYSPKGHELTDRARSNEAAYAVYDPKTKRWSAWQMLMMPDTDSKFFLVAPGCAQWLVVPDGTILLPTYFRKPKPGPYVTTVLRCTFDGATLKYQKHGDELSLKVERGLCEPSLVRFAGKFYLTICNDHKGYVTVSKDGLHYEKIKPWTYDDGKYLGSYNTQQHWLAHSDGLFLVYTRRGAKNDHIIRHRAPLFIAQVDPEKLVVLRKTERILIPERGGEFGNFGAAAINERESWVTVGEGVWSDDARKRGAKGAVFIARVVWSRPNKLVATK